MNKTTERVGMITAVALLAVSPRVFAADGTWNVNAAGNWIDAANWASSSIPGVSDGGTTITNLDKATFGTVIGAARAISVDANRNLATIDFAGNAYAYTLSGGSILLSNGGSIQTSGAGSGHTDLISTPITLEGDGGTATFTGGSTTATRLLRFSGNIAGVSSAGKTNTLVLTGSNTGVNVLDTGTISDGPGGGKLALTKSGAGTWLLSSSNTFSGGVTLENGTLRLGQAAALGTGTLTISGGTVYNAVGATLSLSNAQVWAGNFALADTAKSVDIRNASSIVLTDDRTLTVGGTSVNVLYVGAISDGGQGHSLTLNGTGRVVLDRNSTFSGGVTLNSGELAIGGNDGIGGGAGTGTLTINGGSIVTSWSTVSTVLANNPQVWGGDFSVITGWGLQSMGNGAVTLTSNRQVNVYSSQSFSVGGVISDGGNGYGLTKIGSGAMSLSGASTYGGATTVSGGSLSIAGGNDRLPVGTTLTVNGGAAAGASFNLSGRSQTVAGLSGGSGTVSGNIQNTTGSSTLTVTGTSQFDGIIKNSGGTLALTKSTGGTLTLTGTNTYTGATTITSSTLRVNGALSTSSAVAVNNGGTLGGTGTVGSVTVALGGTLAPGNSAGILTTGNLVLGSGSILSTELNGTTVGTEYDQANVVGTVSLNGATLSSSLTYPASRGDLFFIINNDGTDAVTGTFADLPNNATVTVTANGRPHHFKVSYFGDSVAQTTTGGNDVVLLSTSDAGEGTTIVVR